MNKRYKILAINDRSAELDTACGILAKNGYSVFTVGSVCDGLESAKQNIPDLIISNMLMPETDGIDLCRQVRTDKSLHSVPILLLSTVTTVATKVAEGLKAGADDHIQLPCEPVLLAEKVFQLINRKEIFDDLHLSEARYRDLFENANDIIYIHDLDGNYISINQAAEKVFGYRREEICAMNMDQIVVPEHLELIRQKLAEKKAGDSRQTVYEVDCITKDKRRLTLEVNSAVIYKDDVPVTVQGIARDVTERKLTQKALRNSEEQYRDLYENANDLICTMDLQGNFTSYNRAGEIVTGYSREEAITMNFSQLLVPEFLDRVRERLANIMSGQPSSTYELQIFTKDGRRVWLELNSRLILQDGKPTGVQGMGRDITERKRAEAESEAISAIIKGVTTTSDLDELLELVHQSLQKVLYAENCYVALHDKETDLIHVPFCKDKFDTVAPPQKLGRGLTGYVLRKGRPMLMSPEVIQQLISQGEIELVGTWPAIWLGVPLRTPAGIIGVLVVQHYEDKNVYSQRDLELLNSVGDQIALAIEHKRIEEALRDSEERYRLFFDSNPFPMWVFDRDTHAFLTVNDAAITHYGYSREEFLSMTLEQIRRPEDVPELLERLSDESGIRKSTGIWRHLKKDGTLIEAEITSHPLNFAGKRAAIVLINDVTERSQAEREKTELGIQLEYQRQRLKNIIANLPGIVWETTIDQEALPNSLDFVSDHVVTMLGYSIEEWLSSPNFWLDIVHPDDRKRTEDEAYANFANGKSSTLEFRWITKDGRVIWVETRSVIVRSDAGAPAGLRGVTIDISERKMAEEALRESREHFALAQQVAHVGSFEFDPNTQKIILSPELEAIYGMAPGTMGETFEEWLRYVHPEDIPSLQKDTERILLSGGSLNNDFRILHSDGTVRWVNATGKAFYDDKGNPTRLVGVNIDITERKMAEEARRENEAKFRDLFDNAPVAYHELDTEGCFTRVNHTEELLLGYTDEELKGRPVWEIIVEKEHREDVLARLSGKSRLHPVERTFVRKDGSFVSVLKEDRLIFDADGNINGIRSTLQDITQRKLDEEQLRISDIKLAEANERAIREYDQLLQRLATLAQATGAARDLATIFTAILNFAVESVPCSGLFISLYDPQLSTRKLLYMWYGNKEVDISDLDPVQVDTGPAGQSLTTGEVIIVNDYQNTVEKKLTNVYIGYVEDSRDPRSTIVAPMKIMGNAIGVIEVQSYELDAYTEEHATALRMAANLAANAIENVRLFEQERKNAGQLRESQKLESVGRLAGGIAHDFNNMLTAINGYSDLTLKRLPEGDALRHNIEEIKKAGERSASLTQQLLAFSRRQILKPKMLDINHEVIEVSMLLKRLIGEDIQLITNLKPKLGQVKADPGQLTQVIMNLAVNARDSMPQGGELVIETSNVYLDADYAARHIGSRPGSYVMIAVIDNGEGMSGEIQQHIFEPFYTTKETGKGTGLGLATAYGIVKQSGGHIWVYSEIGKGTTFKVYLPRVDEEADTPKENDTSDHIPDGTETILLVEDEEIVRNLSRQILEACGYKVIGAGDGVEALSICQQPDSKFDLLLTDVVMPRMSGRQLAEHLDTLRPDTKVLFMSGYTDDAIIRQGVIEVGENFIQKPFTFNALARKVRELLDA